MKNICPFCKEKLPNDSIFCVHCGSDLRLLEAPIIKEEIITEPDTQTKKGHSITSIFNIAILILAILCIAAFIFYRIEDAINSTADKDNKNEEIIDNLYRNTKYKFRIKFPEKWEIQKGDGPNILIKATNANGSNINIYVKDSGIPIGDIDALFTLEEWAESVQQEFPDAKLLMKKEISLSNRKAYYIKYSITYKALDKEANSTMYNVALTHKNYFYAITASAKTRLFESERLTLDTSVSTFVVENW